MGHLFVPAALVLWVGVAVVRSLATPAPAATSTPAVEVEVQRPSPADSSGPSVWEARQAEAQVKGEG